MKPIFTRVITISLLLALLLGCLAACGNTAEETQPPTEAPEATNAPTEAPDVTPSPTEEPATEAPESSAGVSGDDEMGFQAFYNSLGETYELPGTIELDAEMLEVNYPGISDVDTQQVFAQTAAISAVAFELVLVACTDSADVETVREIFETRIETQTAGGAWYPATIETWSEAQIAEHDNIIMLIAGENASEIVEAFEAQF